MKESKKTAATGKATSKARKKSKKSIPIPSHIKVIPSDEEGPTWYECTCCQKKFKTKLNIHYHEFCPEGKKKPFICDICGNGFITKTHYEYHLRTHTGELPFECSICSRRFNQKAKVTRHMKSHSGDRPHPCSQCNKAFRWKWKLALHEKIHGSSNLPYRCDDCGLGFTNKKDYRRHQLIHSCERPYKCDVCGSSFRRKDNFFRHLKKLHDRTVTSADNYLDQSCTNKSETITMQESPAAKLNTENDGSLIKLPSTDKPDAIDQSRTLSDTKFADNINNWFLTNLSEKLSSEGVNAEKIPSQPANNDISDIVDDSDFQLIDLTDEVFLELDTLDNFEFGDLQPLEATELFDMEPLNTDPSDLFALV